MTPPDVDPADLHAKRARLEGLLSGLGAVAIAFSGGVDSTVLLATARRVLGRDKVLAVTATGDIFPPGEADEARALADRLDAAHEVLAVHPLDSRHFRENPPDRCYYCKLSIFGAVLAMAKRRGLAAVCDGGNVDDAGVHRPGMRAIAELGVRSPLKEAGLAKRDIRALARDLDLPVWNRPAMPCLATRFPYGHPVTLEGLKRVAAAEAVLQDLGFSPCRVRDHGPIARLEVPAAETARLVADHRDRLLRDLKALGYAYVTVDLAGYRSGAMDEVLPPAAKAT